MQVTACTSFSIATSTEGMPIAATEIDYFRGTGTDGQIASAGSAASGSTATSPTGAPDGDSFPKPSTHSRIRHEVDASAVPG